MVFRASRLHTTVLAALIVAAQCGSILAQSYTPEHPKVKAMVDRGTEFLNGWAGASGGSGFEAGETILVGYTLLKVTGDADHPKVKQGIASAVGLANSLANFRERGESKVVYEASIAAVLLATVDSGKYQPQLGKILYWLGSIQKSHGGFGYLGKPTGDTSQVQYVMLALWTMNATGMDIPVELVESTIGYLRSTRDPSGGWGYQGKVSTGRLVVQDGVTKSLSTAGVGALIIGADILGIYGKRMQEKPDEDEGIPEAFVRIDLEKKRRAARREISLSREDVDGPVSLAVRYQNATRFTGLNWYYYWRYSQERYESFLEIVEGKQNKSPAWYNDGVSDLEDLQEENGAWGSKDVVGPAISTSFAILFLIRSTQKAIGKLDEGLAYGGYVLPNDLTTLKMVGDRLVSDEEASVENLLSMLEGDQAEDVQVGLLPKNLQLTKDPAQRKEQVARLSRLLVSKDYRARRIAAKLLGRSEDLDQVPDLIYALTDEDPHVPMIAEEGLRLLSRKLISGKLEADPTPAEKKAAENFWKQWYLGLRPDYIFIAR